MTNVLITGSNGQLGSCLREVGKSFENLNLIFTDYLELDICDFKQVKIFFEANTQIHYCINCAAYTAVDKAEIETEKAFQINVIGAKNLALACNENAAILIHVSTDFVFDGKKTVPYSETDEAKPVSVYGATKLQGEVEIKKILKEHFIIRTSWLYSEHGINFMKTMLRLANSRNEISVVDDQISTPTYAGDLANIILKIISSNNNNFGLFHYSNNGVASWYEFAKTIFEESKIQIKVSPIKSETYPTLAKRPHFSVLNKTKIKNHLQIEIPHWKDSLRKAIANNHE